MESFDGRVVVITGGATGIGFSFARRFAAEGAKVWIAGIDPDRNAEAVAAIEAEGQRASSALCDVREREQVEALADRAWAEDGRVDVILNNAGIGSIRSTVIDAKREDIDAVLAVNLFGVWNGVSVFGRRFIDQGTPAAIYNVGSENSFFSAAPNTSSYIVSKHGVFAMTEALREEVPDFIDVGLIIPGFVQSELLPDMSLGMETDRFTGIAMEQMKAGEFYIVSHAYNIVKIEERQREIADAYARYAPRYEGDDEYDVRTLLARIMGARRSD